MSTYKCLNPECNKDFDEDLILAAHVGGGITKACCPKCYSLSHGIVGFETDLEKFKRLFDQVGVKYTESNYSLTTDLTDFTSIEYSFDENGKYEAVYIYR